MTPPAPPAVTAPVPPAVTPTDPRDIFLRGKHVILKALSERDVIESNWYGWFNSSDTTRMMQQHRFPNTAEEQLQFFKQNILGSRTKLQLGLLDVGGGPLLGVVSLNNIDYVNSSAEFAAIIGEKQGRNVKLYLEAAKLLVHHGFSTLNLNRIYAGSLWKENGILLCRALGFRDEGVGREEVYKDGAYRDVYRVGLLRREFQFEPPSSATP